ncbi:hypothetical protein [Agathobaculum sp.]|uniref:hypothetical protein n=1 Tax=Agathobaculum sp. TaxID=2048138 RepID=UPI002A7FFA06|nr:hypothetical protein [Agathobaculum sp.]MDY3618058.1 hypothetical protein [Agathobaculum sp.]
MKEERSFVYTLILGVCMLLSLVLIGKMLLHRSEQPKQPDTPPQADQQQEDNMEVQIGEDDLGALITQALPFAPEELTVRIAKSGTVEVSASVDHQALLDSGAVPGSMRTAMMFLPDPCKVYGAWQVTWQDGTLLLTAQRMEIAGFELPEQTAGALTEAIAGAVNGQIKEWGDSFAEFICQDGSLVLKP